MNFKALLATATLGVVGLTGTPALANGHWNLRQAVEAKGVPVNVNPKECDGDFMGAYYPSQGKMVICQEGGKQNGPEVNWTDEDLDTLRHETWHLIQDCKDGFSDNYTLKGMFTKPQLEEYKKITSLSPSWLNGGMEASYRENGANDHVIHLEYEAFMVAADMSPEWIQNQLNQTCKG